WQGPEVVLRSGGQRFLFLLWRALLKHGHPFNGSFLVLRLEICQASPHARSCSFGIPGRSTRAAAGCIVAQGVSAGMAYFGFKPFALGADSVGTAGQVRFRNLRRLGRRGLTR